MTRQHRHDLLEAYIDIVFGDRFCLFGDQKCAWILLRNSGEHAER